MEKSSFSPRSLSLAPSTKDWSAKNFITLGNHVNQLEDWNDRPLSSKGFDHAFKNNEETTTTTTTAAAAAAATAKATKKKKNNNNNIDENNNN